MCGDSCETRHQPTAKRSRTGSDNDITVPDVGDTTLRETLAYYVSLVTSLQVQLAEATANMNNYVAQTRAWEATTAAEIKKLRMENEECLRKESKAVTEAETAKRKLRDLQQRHKELTTAIQKSAEEFVEKHASEDCCELAGLNERASDSKYLF